MDSCLCTLSQSTLICKRISFWLLRMNPWHFQGPLLLLHVFMISLNCSMIIPGYFSSVSFISSEQSISTRLLTSFPLGSISSHVNMQRIVNWQAHSSSSVTTASVYIQIKFQFMRQFIYLPMVPMVYSKKHILQ